jgi:catechol 2,3-dioxygenase-like lactoylglutathione lyase family enzyme
MKVQRFDHMHAWTDDVDRVARLFHEVLGMTAEIYEFEQMKIKTTVVRVGDDRRFIEFLQPHDPGEAMWQDMGPPRTPGVFGVNLKVDSIDDAIETFAAHGIKLIRDSRIGGVRQAWFDTQETFGVQIELSEYGDHIFEEAGIQDPRRL